MCSNNLLETFSCPEGCQHFSDSSDCTSGRIWGRICNKNIKMLYEQQNRRRFSYVTNCPGINNSSIFFYESNKYIFAEQHSTASKSVLIVTFIQKVSINLNVVLINTKNLLKASKNKPCRKPRACEQIMRCKWCGHINQKRHDTQIIDKAPHIKNIQRILLLFVWLKNR